MKWATLTIIAILLFVTVAPLLSNLNILPNIPTAQSTPADATITVDPLTTLHSNVFRIGFALDGQSASYWRGSTTAQQYTATNNYAMMRIFDHRLGNPCTNWNEATKTGTWSWSAYDDLINDLIAVGVEPMICLGYYSSSSNALTSAPSGMTRNWGGTYLPDPAQYVEYAKDWVAHFTGKVNYYELINEPYIYYGWGGSNTARLGYFKTFFNTVFLGMKSVDASINIGNDASMMSANGHTAWWANNIETLDFLSWHAYLSSGTSDSNSTLLTRAQTDEGGMYGDGSYIEPARTTYHSITGVWLNCICTEENLSYAWNPGDTRTIQILNAIVEAIRYRTYILNGHILSALYWEFAGPSTYYLKMVHRTSNYRYFPFYTHSIMFSDEYGRLSYGDSIVTATSTSSDILVLAWKHSTLNTLMIVNKATTSRTVLVSGLTGTYDKFTLNNNQESIQTGTQSLGPTTEFTVTSYSITILRQQTGSDNPPTYGNHYYNSTVANTKCQFSLQTYDDIDLDSFYFSHNNSGSWANETIGSLSGTSAWANKTITLNAASAKTIQFKWYIKDSANQWTTTLIYSILTEATNTPQYSNAQTTTNLVGTSCTFKVQWTDVEGLSGFIYGTNNTGSWVNETWTDPWSGTPTSGWSNQTKTLNAAVGAIEWRIWANDTDDYWGDTGDIILITEEEQETDIQYFDTEALLQTNFDYEAASYPFLVYSNGTITALSYSSTSKVLQFTVDATGVSLTQVRAQNLDLLSVINATSSYNSGTDTLSLWATHASEVDILVAFETPTLSISRPKGSVVFNPGMAIKNTATNTLYTFSSATTLCFATVDTYYTWLGQSYSNKHYTPYCIYSTTSDAQVEINSWFPTLDSAGNVKATIRTITASTLTVYSPNFLSTPIVAGATVTVSSTTGVTFNAAAGATVTIWTTADETEFNTPPENVGVTITNMDVGNYVFSETKYYTFRALYWDGDGYGDLAEMDIAFYDGLHTIQANYYYDSGFELESGTDELSGNSVAIVTGSTTVIDNNEIQVDFQIRLTRYVLDADNVDIQMKCIDDSGAVDGWEYMQRGYFNIYNVGGHSTLTTSGNAGRLDGGGVFDLYAYDNSYAEATIEFKNLQHVKLMPTLDYGNTTSQSIELEYGIDYYVDGAWLQRFDIHTHFSSTLDTADNRYVVLLTSYRIYNASEPTGFTLINDLGTAFFIEKPNDIEDVTYRTKFWFDFWFSNQNGSTTIAARMNAYEYPMTNNANPIWRWLAGDNWGVKEGYAQESRSIVSIADAEDSVISSHKIEMVRIRCHLHTLAGGNDYAQLAIHDVFDLTLGNSPLEGIQTPIFDATKIPVMINGGGFLGSIFSIFSGVWQTLSNIFGPAILAFWNVFVGFLDSIFTALGWPNGFSQILGVISSFFGWLITSITYLIQILAQIFIFIASILVTTVTYFANFISTLSTMYGYLVWIWEGALPYWSWIPEVLIALLPFIMFLAVFWHIEPLFVSRNLAAGLQGVRSRVELTFGTLYKIAMFLWKIIDFAIDTIYRLVEMIPVAE